jgi:hypothetical protein
MRRTLQWAGLFLALAAVPPFAAAADKGMAGDKKEAAAKMIAAGELTGRVVNVEQTKKSFTLEVTLTYQVPNPGAIANIANIKLQMAQARDINTVRNLQVQLLQAQVQMMQVHKENHNIDVDASDDVKVRLKDPPVTFDDKGNVKKYTAKELKELKGDPKLPGYAGDFDSIHQDQIIQVTLSKMKEAPKKAGKEKDKDADALAGDNKPVATMIMILAEPRGSDEPERLSTARAGAPRAGRFRSPPLPGVPPRGTPREDSP